MARNVLEWPGMARNGLLDFGPMGIWPFGFWAPWVLGSGRPNRTGLTGLTEPVRYPVRFGPVRHFPEIPNRTFLTKLELLEQI